MDTKALLKEFVEAVYARDGERFARLFTEDGSYDDIFYGLHKGRAQIAEMVNERFFEFAEDFRWDMLDPVTEGNRVMVRCIFSYVSHFENAVKPRVLMESVSMLKLKDGLIHEYTEVVNNGPALLELGFAPEGAAKVLRKQASKLRARPEAQRHLQ
ncbi:MAG: nuclear transport factor 2 family protein [Hyphomonadaceae bacterium]